MISVKSFQAMMWVTLRIIVRLVDLFSRIMIGARVTMGRCSPDPSARMCLSVDSAWSGAQKAGMIIETLTPES